MPRRTLNKAALTGHKGGSSKDQGQAAENGLHPPPWLKGRRMATRPATSTMLPTKQTATPRKGKKLILEANPSPKAAHWYGLRGSSGKDAASAYYAPAILDSPSSTANSQTSDRHNPTE